eukprot:226121-Chlamydomonas_euryale.AAC.1
MAGAGRSPLASGHQPELVQGHKEEGQGRVPAGRHPPQQLGNHRNPLGYRPRRTVAEVEHEKPARQHCMPASDVLLPSHGAETPVCQPARQHVGRHPGEGTLPAARGLTAVYELSGHAAEA